MSSSVDQVPEAHSSDKVQQPVNDEVPNATNISALVVQPTENNITPSKRENNSLSESQTKKKQKRIDKFKEETEALLRTYGFNDVKEATEGDKRVTRSRTRGSVTTPTPPKQPEAKLSSGKRGRKSAEKNDAGESETKTNKRGRGRQSLKAKAIDTSAEEIEKVDLAKNDLSKEENFDIKNDSKIDDDNGLKKDIGKANEEVIEKLDDEGDKSSKKLDSKLEDGEKVEKDKSQ